MDTNLILTIVIFNTSVLIGLSVALFIVNGRSRLARQGFSEEYIEFSRKTAFKESIVWVSLFFLIQIIAAYVIYKIFGELTSNLYVNNVFFTSFLLIMPVRYWQSRSYNPKLKKLALKTKADIVIDFDFKILHLIFNPKLEIPTGLLLFYYITFVLDYSNYSTVSMHMVLYLYLVLGWYMYLDLRGYKYLTKPLFKSYYEHVGKFMIFIHIFLLLMVLTQTLTNVEDKGGFNLFGYFIFGALMGILITKFVYYIINLKAYKKALREITLPISN